MERTREAKSVKTGDGDFSHLRSQWHICSRFWQRFFDQGSSNDPYPKFKKYRVSNLKPQGGNYGGNESSISTSQISYKSHLRKRLMDTETCFGCGKSDYCLRDFPSRMEKGKFCLQALPSVSGSSAPMQNWFNELQTRHDL